MRNNEGHGRNRSHVREIAMFEYFIRSTVLGGEVVADLKFTGEKQRRYVFAGGSRLAELGERYTFNPSATHDVVQFYHRDPAGVSQRVSRNSPETLLGYTSQEPNYIDPRHAEFDPSGSNVGLVTNFTYQSVPGPDQPIPIESEAVFIVNGQTMTATQDGLPISAQTLQAMAASGSAGVVLSTGNRHDPYRYFVPLDLVNGQIVIPTNFTGADDQRELLTPYYAYLNLSSVLPGPRPRGPSAGEPETPPSGTSNCESVIRNILGDDVWNQVAQLVAAPPLFDITALPPTRLFTDEWAVNIGGEENDAADYFGGFARSGESLGRAFDRLRTGEVLVVRGNGSFEGIYYRGTVTSFLGAPNFLIHEVLHLVHPARLSGPEVNLDTVLLLDLNIRKDPGMGDSEAVSRFFNSGCDRRYGGVIGTG